MTFIGKFRADESEFIDVTDKETRSWLGNHFPAIMAERPVNMSDNYQFMPSYQIAEILQKNFDMRLHEVHQQWSRSRDPRGQEHYMKFRMPSGLVNLSKVGDSLPELVIMNSHNGRSTIRAYAGIFRLVCSNGMVVSERSFGQIKLRHFGERNSFDEFRKVLLGMAGNMAVLDNRMGLMSEIMLTKHMQNQLAKAMMEARKVPGWLDAKDVLEARRAEDATDDAGKRSLWTTYNVVQENLTNRAISVPVEGTNRSRAIRPITGARADVLTNEKLWSTLEDFIQEKFPKLAKEAFAKPDEAQPELEMAEA